jgi:hypothetical protein
MFDVIDEGDPTSPHALLDAADASGVDHAAAAWFSQQESAG